MQTYISMLRGINVSGKNKIPMKDLKVCCEKIGLKNVVTYIQTGNIVFQYPGFKTVEKTEKMISEAIKKEFGFEVPVLVLSANDIKEAVNKNPFIKERDIQTDKLHITFLSLLPSDELLKKINEFDFPPDRFSIHGQNIYLYTPGGYGNTKLSNNFFESKLKVQATTRNWKTVNELVRLSE